MFLKESIKLEEIIAIIASPFAAAATALLAVLSFLEYFRHGFVSLFLDMRIVAGSALVLWIVSSVFDSRPKRRSFSIVWAVVLLASCSLVVWKMTAPFGRLGLVTFGAAVLVAVMAFIASIGDKVSDSPISEREHSTLGDYH